METSDDDEGGLGVELAVLAVAVLGPEEIGLATLCLAVAARRSLAAAEHRVLKLQPSDRGGRGARKETVEQ